MKRLSGRRAGRRLIAVAGAALALSAGLGAATASAASAAPRALAASVSVAPCAVKYAAGYLYIGSGNAVYKVSQRTGAATRLAPGFSFAAACGIAVDGAGNVLVANGDDVVAVAARNGTFYGRRMTAGHVYPVATGFQLTGAVDVQLDPAGNLVIAVGGAPASHTDNETDSQVLVHAERAGAFYGKKMAMGKTYVIAGVLNGGPSPTPCDVQEAAAADAAAPAAPAATKATQANLGFNIGPLRLDAKGNIILADTGGDEGAPCGADSWDVPARVAVIPARTGSYYGQRMTVGYVYAIAGLGAKAGNAVPAVDGDLPGVSGVAIDHAGNILVAATNSAHPEGGIRVIAARSGTFYGQKMRQGDIYALPGLAYADVLAVDNAGNVLVGEDNYFRVQMLAAKTGDYYGARARAGRVYTVAGDGRPPI